MKIRKRKKLPKWYFTISLSGPILWVVFAKVLEVSYDKLFICSLLSMPCSFIISLIWLIDFYDKVPLEYDDEIIKLRQKISENNRQASD